MRRWRTPNIQRILQICGHTLTAKGRVSVESIDLVKSTGGTVAFSITIKNAGNKPVTTLSVNLEGQDSALTVTLPDGSLEPCQSVSHVEDSIATPTMSS